MMLDGAIEYRVLVLSPHNGLIPGWGRNEAVERALPSVFVP